MLVDAVSYLVSGLLTATISVEEPRGRRLGLDRDGTLGRTGPTVMSELREGVSWVYRHRTLMPQAVSTHVWFLFFSVLTTVYAPFVLNTLGLDAFGLGVTVALAGVGGVVGATLSTRLGTRAGIATTITGGFRPSDTPRPRMSCHRPGRPLPELKPSTASGDRPPDFPTRHSGAPRRGFRISGCRTTCGARRHAVRAKRLRSVAGPAGGRRQC